MASYAAAFEGVTECQCDNVPTCVAAEFANDINLQTLQSSDQIQTDTKLSKLLTAPTMTLYLVWLLPA